MSCFLDILNTGGQRRYTISRIVSELHYVFNMKFIEEVNEHYCNSPC